MKKVLYATSLCICLFACGGKKNPERTPEQEIQAVDSATQETNARVDEIEKSVEDLQNEVDSLLNESK